MGDYRRNHTNQRNQKYSLNEKISCLRFPLKLPVLRRGVVGCVWEEAGALHA